VPSFENSTQNVAEVVLAHRGDRELLASGVALQSLLQQVNNANKTPSANERSSQAQRDAVLKGIASQYGLQPGELDMAFRDWGARSRDPFDKGLAALYVEDYPAATAALTESLRVREAKADAALSDVADTSTFLGQSLYEQGRYRESVTAYDRAVQIRADDGNLLNNLGLSVSQTAAYERAESLFRRALVLNERAYGTDDARIVSTLNNLANVLLAQNRFSDAAPLIERGLTIRRAQLLPTDPRLANSLSNAGAMRLLQRKCAEAEPLLREAESIFRRNPVPRDIPQRAVSPLSNSSVVVTPRPPPRPMEQRVLVIAAPGVSSGQPGLASVLMNLAGVRVCQSDLPGAESFLRQAVGIQQAVFGPSHPETANGHSLLGDILLQEGKTTEAIQHFKEALAVRERLLGTDHPATKDLRAKIGAR
jgi:tetratricopeptide (TPR) repeat protein